jgi:hypothetical protein
MPYAGSVNNNQDPEFLARASQMLDAIASTGSGKSIPTEMTL